MALEKQVISVGGCRVAITEAPGKPLMIFTRMASQEMGIWDPIWPTFADYFTVASFELIEHPGFEKLDKPGEAFRLLASACADVATGLGHQRFHLFGWFGGSQVALRCLVDYPDRVASAILLDPFYELTDMRKIEKAIEFKRILFEHPDRELYSYYWVMAGFTPEFMERNFDAIERLAKARVAKDRFVQTDTDRWMKWVRALRRNWVTAEELARIAAPVLLVATTLDSWHAGPTPGMARELHARIPSARLEIMEGAGTFIFIEAPDRFARTIAPFLREVTGRPD